MAEPSESHHGLYAKYESLDYEVCDSRLSRKLEKQPGHQFLLWRQSMNRWIIAFFIGVFTALVACFIDIMVFYASELKFSRILRNVFERCRVERCLYMGLLTWLSFNCAFVFVAAVLVVYISGPVAAGSGIPQIKCFLNGVMIPGVVRVKTLIAKAIGVAFSVAGGLSVGKEGPMIHSGAVIAAGISQGRCVTVPLDCGVFECFRNDKEKRDFVSAGAAAGVAAAFGAPIGGVLFSLEEGASFWNQALTWRMFFSSMVSSFTLSAILSLFYGQGGLLSWSGLANFGTFKDVSYNIWEIPVFLLIGALGGLTGALFNAVNYNITKFRNRYLTKSWQKLLEALLVAAVSAVVAFLSIYLLDDCQHLGVNPNITEPIQLWCPNGYYSAVAELYFRSPEEGVKSLFHSPRSSFRPETLLVFSVSYFALSTWTYGLSVPSGLFIPTLLTGAAWGRLVGLALDKLFPDVVGGIDPGKYALAGAAAQLGGVVRMTISLCAILVEATRDITFGLPIMLILMMAKWVGDYFNEGLYDIHIEVAGVPILKWEPPRASLHIEARDVMNAEVQVIRPVEKVGRIFDLLKFGKHHGFPVVRVDENEQNLKKAESFVAQMSAHASSSTEEVLTSQESRRQNCPEHKGKLVGLMRRNQLIMLITHRIFHQGGAGGPLILGWRALSESQFHNAFPTAEKCLEKVELTNEERECYLCVGDYMNLAPHRVPLNASLPSIFHLFRGLGLRHLVVVDRGNHVCGIITRKDLAKYRECRLDEQWYGVAQVPIYESFQA